MTKQVRIMMVAVLFLTGLFAVAAQAQIPNAKEVVNPSAYASLEPVPQGHTFQVAVVLKIRPGFHINARETSAEYLIATDLKVNLPAGFKPGEVSYPKGTLKTFSFSKTPLNVYEGTAIVRFPVTALSSAPLGEQHLPLRVKYQACSNEVCLPPVTLDVDTVITVATSTATPKRVHEDLFAVR